MAREYEASGDVRQDQQRQRARTTERESNAYDFFKTTSELIILVANLGDGQEALIHPGLVCALPGRQEMLFCSGRCLIYSARRQQGGEERAHDLWRKYPAPEKTRDTSARPPAVREGDGAVIVILPAIGGRASASRPSAGEESATYRCAPFDARRSQGCCNEQGVAPCS